MPTEGVTTNIPDLQRALSKLTGAQVLRPMSKAAVKIAEQLKERLMVNPGRPSYPLKWASKKQRAWYFAARARDKLSPHYVRTSDPWSQKSRQSWAVEARPAVGGAVLGNRATYAAYTQSDEFQTAMHKDTGWKTDKMAVSEVERLGIMAQYIEAEIKSYLDSVFRGLG